MNPTETVHQRIEALAAALIDITSHLDLTDPATLEHLRRYAPTGSGAVLNETAIRLAADGERPSLVAYNTGPELALLQATLADISFSKARATLTYCQHITSITDAPCMVFAPLRRVVCPVCVPLICTPEIKTQLDNDNACDVCGADRGSVTPRILPLGPVAYVNMFTGPCCDELFNYVEPVRTRTYRKVGRNEPCPCGSGRKVKRCACGVPA